MDRIAFLTLPQEKQRKVIKDEICSVFGLTDQEFGSASKTDRLAMIRALYYYLCWIKRTGLEREIAKEVGRRSSSSTIRGKYSVVGYLTVNDGRFMPIWNLYIEKAKPFLLP